MVLGLWGLRLSGRGLISSWRFGVVAVAASGLCGCTAFDPATQASLSALWERAWVSGGPETPSQLNPSFDFLRVTVNGTPSLLARGYTEPDPAGPITVWYSGEREVLRLQRGRLAGLTGTPVEWRHVRGLASAPLASTDHADAAVAPDQQWVREVDQMPGYRWRLRDELVMRPIVAPSGTALQGVSPQALHWAQEQDAPGRLPPARYAWVPGQVEPVYGEQCLHVDFCLTWQRWTASGPAALVSAVTP